jgi:ketosteroid isomerase-like protein
VLRVYPAPDVDVVALVREEARWAPWRESVAAFFAHDAESVWPGLPGGGKTFAGLDGLRTALLDWTGPWATYRTEVEEAIDCGDRVALLAPSFGRLADSGEEIRLDGASAWTVHDGKISQNYHSTRADGLRLVGLER